MVAEHKKRTTNGRPYDLAQTRCNASPCGLYLILRRAVRAIHALPDGIPPTTNGNFSRFAYSYTKTQNYALKKDESRRFLPKKPPIRVLCPGFRLHISAGCTKIPHLAKNAEIIPKSGK